MILTWTWTATWATATAISTCETTNGDSKSRTHTHAHSCTDLPILRTRAGHKDQLQTCAARKEGSEGEGLGTERTSWERNSLAKLSCNACNGDQSISRCWGPWVAGCQGSSNWSLQLEYSACPLRIRIKTPHSNCPKDPYPVGGLIRGLRVEHKQRKQPDPADRGAIARCWRRLWLRRRLRRKRRMKWTPCAAAEELERSVADERSNPTGVLRSWSCRVSAEWAKWARERAIVRKRENERGRRDPVCGQCASAKCLNTKSINVLPKCTVQITHSDFHLQSILCIYTIYTLYVSLLYPCIYPCGAQRRAPCRLIEISQRNGFIEAVAVSIWQTCIPQIHNAHRHRHRHRHRHSYRYELQLQLLPRVCHEIDSLCAAPQITQSMRILISFELHVQTLDLTAAAAAAAPATCLPHPGYVCNRHCYSCSPCCSFSSCCLCIILASILFACQITLPT